MRSDLHHLLPLFLIVATFKIVAIASPATSPSSKNAGPRVEAPRILPLFPLTPGEGSSTASIARGSRGDHASSSHGPAVPRATMERSSRKGRQQGPWWSTRLPEEEKEAFNHVLDVVVQIAGRRPNGFRGNYYHKLAPQQKQQVIQVYRSRGQAAILELARSIAQAQRGHIKPTRKRWSAEHVPAEVKALKALAKEAKRNKYSTNAFFAAMTREQRLRTLVPNTSERALLFAKKPTGRPPKYRT